MRCLRVSFASCLAVATVQACFYSYGTTPVDPPAEAGGLGMPDSNAPTDASTDPNMPLLDGGPQETCFDFSKGSNHDFILAGGASVSAGTGLVLNFSKNSAPEVRRTFVAAKPISTTTLKLEGAINQTTSWGDAGPAGPEFVNLLRQHYGSTQASATLAASTVFFLTKRGSISDVELNTWHAPNELDGNDRIGPFLGGVTSLSIQTEYKPAGKVSFAIAGGPVAVLDANTLSGQKSTLFTLALGGGATANAPNIQLTVQTLCISFD